MKKGEGLYNLVVIGAGTAGLVTAAGSVALGARVALIERRKMGGDCLNFGCVPSKALISSARLLQRMREAKRWGLKSIEPDFDSAEVFASMRAARAEIAPLDSQERFESLGVDVFADEAIFVSPHEIEVGGERLRAKHFIIATGTRAAIPAVIGASKVPYFTNETIFDDLEKKPENLLIVGGGPIGCEIGQMFNRLGVKVTLIEGGKRLLKKEDPEISEFVRETFAAEGIRVVTGAEIEEAQEKSGRITLRCKEDSFTGDTLLICAGRQPNVESLNLQAAQVAFTKKGITVDEHLQTTQPHIYAIGD
ncbi:MAG: FAD-dependent oxidoreductase, partial [Chthoniobacterales bacterium]